MNLGWCKSLIKGYHLATQKYSLFIPGDGEARITEFLKDFELDKKRFNYLSKKKYDRQT